MTITKKLTNEQLLNAIYRSAAEYENLLGKDFLIIIPRRIDEFAVQKYRINFVFDKVQRNEQYENLLMEIKEGVFAQHYEMFPEKLKVRVKIDKFVRH